MAAPNPVKLVVTSWSPRGWAEYGLKWLQTFKSHWQPAGLQHIPITDSMIEMDVEAANCLRALANDPVTGNQRDIHKGCSKWARKVFALTLARFRGIRDGWVLWIDGDVEFTAPPTQAFFREVCDHAWDLSYLGRPWAYASETGFVGYNMASSRTRLLLAMMRDVYLTGHFRELPEWGDAGVFDWCRGCIPGLMDKNLAMHLIEKQNTVEQKGLHVWPHTVLAPFMRHNKGPKRKKAAYGKM